MSRDLYYLIIKMLFRIIFYKIQIMYMREITDNNGGSPCTQQFLYILTQSRYIAGFI